MSPEKVLQASYFVDISIKTFIAIAVAVAGFHFKDISSSVRDLQDQNAKKSAQIAVLESSQQMLFQQLGKMDNKLDKLLEDRR